MFPARNFAPPKDNSSEIAPEETAEDMTQWPGKLQCPTWSSTTSSEHFSQRHQRRCNMLSNRVEVYQHTLDDFKNLWLRLSDLFPQLDATCVGYHGDQPYPRKMCWTIPEVTREYWEKVVNELPKFASVVFPKTGSSRAVLTLRDPVIHEFAVASWAYIITEWWGG